MCVFHMKVIINILERFICLVEVHNNTVNYTQTIKIFILVKFFITNQLASLRLVYYDTVLQQMDYCKVVMVLCQLL